jgi:hypothetical protein
VDVARERLNEVRVCVLQLVPRALTYHLKHILSFNGARQPPRTHGAAHSIQSSMLASTCMNSWSLHHCHQITIRRIVKPAQVGIIIALRILTQTPTTMQSQPTRFVGCAACTSSGLRWCSPCSLVRLVSIDFTLGTTLWVRPLPSVSHSTAVGPLHNVMTLPLQPTPHSTAVRPLHNVISLPLQPTSHSTVVFCTQCRYTPPLLHGVRLRAIGVQS